MDFYFYKIAIFSHYFGYFEKVVSDDEFNVISLSLRFVTKEIQNLFYRIHFVTQRSNYILYKLSKERFI